MTPLKNPHLLSLNELHNYCVEETTKFWRKKGDEAWHCYEIFRRAIVDKDGRAWDIIVEQYQSQVQRWVEKNPRFHAVSEGPDIFVNLVFEKFWGRNFSAGEFSGFPNVKSILAYLKTCVSSVITDFWRTQKRKENVAYLEDLLIEGANSPAFSYPARMEERMARADFWDEIHRFLEDEISYTVIYFSFVQDLKPLEIMEQFPAWFGDVRDVYKVKAKAMSILEREYNKREIAQNFLDISE